jgi:hypothetical protein
VSFTGSRWESSDGDVGGAKVDVEAPPSMANGAKEDTPGIPAGGRPEAYEGIPGNPPEGIGAGA